MEPSDIVALAAVLTSGIVGLVAIGGSIWGVRHQADTSARAQSRAEKLAAYAALLNLAHEANDKAATTMRHVGEAYFKHPHGKAPSEETELFRAWNADADRIRRSATEALVRCRLVGGEEVHAFAAEVRGEILMTTSAALRGEDPVPAIDELVTAAVCFQTVARADLGYRKETPQHSKRVRVAVKAARGLRKSELGDANRIDPSG